ncbi:hypothetical protein ABZ412_16825 [Nocardia sp. NPDC005746]|uniref:WXG100-like domain-containing protein n=1 Tax=Nocardia sp. NPDC005746 TaxID=3157062 RepID=UPI003405778D
MSIDIPGELEWLGWVAGSDWPDGDEDDMWGIAGDWRTAATELRELLPDLRAAKTATIDAYPWGDGLEAMTKALDALDHGPESLEHLAEILDAVAESADGLGTEIEYTKILIISSLAMLAVEIAAAWLFPPTAPLSEALAIGATRVAVRLLGERAVSAIARFAAKTGVAALTRFAAKHVVFSTVLGAGQDLAIQAYQVGAGHRDGIDWERVATTAYTAAAAGAVGGPAGSLLGKAAGRIHLPGGRFGNAVKGAAVGAGSGIAGGLGAWGIGGFANGWTWDPRILTSAGAYGITVGGSKGFRHAPTTGSAGADPFNAADPAMPTGEHPSAPGRAGDGSTPPPPAHGENGTGPHSAADPVRTGAAPTADPTNNGHAAPRSGDPTSTGSGAAHGGDPANTRTGASEGGDHTNPGAVPPRTGDPSPGEAGRHGTTGQGGESDPVQSSPRSSHEGGAPDGSSPHPQSATSTPETKVAGSEGGGAEQNDHGASRVEPSAATTTRGTGPEGHPAGEAPAAGTSGTSAPEGRNGAPEAPGNGPETRNSSTESRDSGPAVRNDGPVAPGSGPEGRGPGAEGRAAGTASPAGGTEGRQPVPEGRGGENRATGATGESRITESPSKSGESNSEPFSSVMDDVVAVGVWCGVSPGG